MKATDPTLVCQVKNPDVYLPCKVMVDEFRCERIERHDSDHWVGEHTVKHRIAGEAYSCAEVEGASEGDSLKPVSPAPAPPAPVVISPQKPAPWSTTKLALALGGGVAVAIVLAVVVQFVLTPFFRGEAQFNEAGDIQPLNSELAPFTGQSIANANAEQKALGVDGEATEPPAFIFSNGEEAEARQRLDLYVDFSDQESRDLILLNQATLKALVESGRVNLYLHAVPTGQAYSMYAPEVLAETFYSNPDRAWAVLLDVLKLAPIADAQDYGHQKLARELARVANDNQVEAVDAQSIQNGTFASWLLSISSDPKLTTGAQLPSLYLADSPIDLDTIDLAANSGFNKALEEN